MRQPSISPNVNTFTKWHFYMRRVPITLLRPTYLNLRRSTQRFLQKRTNVLHFLALAAAIAATLILQKKSSKNKKRRTDSMRPDALAQSLQDCDEMIKRSLTDENDEDYLFCRSLVPVLKEFLQREKGWVKVKIMQLITNFNTVSRSRLAHLLLFVF